jgi:hypothetical protein
MAEDDLNSIKQYLETPLRGLTAAEREFLEAEEKVGYLTKKFPAIIISDLNNQKSIVGVRKLLKSIDDTKSELLPIILPATVPATLERDLAHFNKTLADWKYPPAGETRIDIKSGLKLTGYQARDQRKVIACMVSHMRAWQLLLQAGGGVVFEHDALVVRSISCQALQFSGKGIVGLNHPAKATRKARLYNERVIEQSQRPRYPVLVHQGISYRVVEAPQVDADLDVPQGIAGNSAYFISKKSAYDMLKLTKELGLWPNDALMCKQLIPCNQVFPYLTTIQEMPSTTTG